MAYVFNPFTGTFDNVATVTGSTGISGATANGAMYATAANTGTSTAALTNGQLLIGSTGNAPVAATITQGTGITVTNGSGTITIASAGGGSGTVTSVSVSTANGVSGTVANSTTTPAITLSLGAITPSSVSSSGTVTAGSGSTNDIVLSGSSSAPSVSVASGSSSDIDLSLNPKGNGQLLVGSGGWTYTTAASGAGSIFLSNGGSDSPNIKFAYANVSNFSIDTAPLGNPSGTSGQFMRFIKFADETGGAVVMGVDLSGNLGVVGNGTFGGSLAATNLSGTNTGDQSSVSGNAGTATKLQTARAINGVNFDGSAAITVAAAAGTLTGTALASNVVSSSLTSVGTLATLTVTATIAGSVSGNAATVTTNANLTGPITSSGNATSIASSVALPGSPTTTTQTAGDSSTKISTTAFVATAVSNAISGVNPAVAVQAATTANVSGYTYSNGVSGVGATLTQNSAAVVVIDGYTLLLSDRVLFKNQSTAANNGVYFVSTLGTGLIPAVFTRSLDYDQPSDINNTGAIPVVNGTANPSTSWLLTSSVTTVGTDPLTYTQFTLNPAVVMTVTTYDPAGIAQQVVGRTATQTVTNKRNTKRVVTVTQSATPTMNTDNLEVASITGLAQAITSFTTNLSGTPVDGDTLIVRITDNGTARAISWGSSFESSTQTLPATTSTSTMLSVGFLWNAATSKWRCVAAA